MKNFKYLLIIVAAVMLFASCSDDSIEGAKESGLVGSWVWNSSDYDHHENGDWHQVVHTFKSNGIAITDDIWYINDDEVAGADAYSKTWSVDGDVLTMTRVDKSELEFVYIYYYTITGDKLTLARYPDHYGARTYIRR